LIWSRKSKTVLSCRIAEPNNRFPLILAILDAPFPNQKQYYSQSMSAGSQDMPVSVLDLEQYRLRGHMPQVPPHAEEPAILMFSL